MRPIFNSVGKGFTLLQISDFRKSQFHPMALIIIIIIIIIIITNERKIETGIQQETKNDTEI